MQHKVTFSPPSAYEQADESIADARLHFSCPHIDLSDSFPSFSDTLKIVVDSNLPSTVFLGFCAKKVWDPTVEWGGSWGTHIQEIASVSSCLSKRALNWMDGWGCNRSSLWDDESTALACMLADECSEFHLFGYRLLPIIFDESGNPQNVSIDHLFDFNLSEVAVQPDLSRYESLGYDVVVPPAAYTGFGCSPLSCNGMAQHVSVNRFCLIETIEDALVAAKRFAVEQPEPGPYVIVEVLSDRAARKSKLARQ
jgi:hypothetical protein